MSKPGLINPALSPLDADVVPASGAIAVKAVIDGVTEEVIVMRRDAGFVAYVNRCPHARWPLDTFDGRFLFSPDGDLVCAAHGAVFDPDSGACRGGPGQGLGLTAVPVAVAGTKLVLG